MSNLPASILSFSASFNLVQRPTKIVNTEMNVLGKQNPKFGGLLVFLGNNESL